MYAYMAMMALLAWLKFLEIIKNSVYSDLAMLKALILSASQSSSGYFIIFIEKNLYRVV